MDITNVDLERLVGPDGDVVAEAVRWRVAPGETVALVADGERVAIELRSLLAAAVERDDEVAGAVGPISEGWSEREVAIEAMPGELREAGRRLLALEALAATGADRDLDELGEAVDRWATLGGYALEAAWAGALDEVRRWGDGSDEGETRWVHAAVVALRSDAPTVVLVLPDEMPDAVAEALSAELQAHRSTTTIVLEPPEVLLRSMTSFVTVGRAATWTFRGSAGEWRHETTRRRARHDEAIERWLVEEARLRENVRIARDRAAINSKNASRGDAAETRWRRFLATRPVGLDESAVSRG